MDPFKAQDNDTLKDPCYENNFKIVTVSRNLTMKFQPLGISVNKAITIFCSKLI